MTWAPGNGHVLEQKIDPGDFGKEEFDRLGSLGSFEHRKARLAKHLLHAERGCAEPALPLRVVLQKVMDLEAGTRITTAMARKGECRDQEVTSSAVTASAPGGTLRRLPSAILVLCLFLILPAPASTAEEYARSECSGPVVERFVSERLNLWQERLKLQLWKISIVTSQQIDLRPNTLGNIRWHSEDKSALIQVLDASEYKLSCHEMLNDMEFTVVHELIHLELGSLPRSDATRTDEEVAVNHITNALLALDRRR